MAICDFSMVPRCVDVNIHRMSLQFQPQDTQVFQTYGLRAPIVFALALVFAFSSFSGFAQEPSGEGDVAETSTEITVDESVPAPEGSEGLEPRVKEALDGAKEKVTQLAKGVDESDKANEAKASVLKPIYALAEQLSFPAFHWLAFMFMVTGVVSFALQLVLGKLVALTKLGFSLTEILSDALGLVISLVGLVLTTQAATENSTFTNSAFAVLSATIVGLVLGIMFYVWGQRQELQAIDARKANAAAKE